VWNLGCCFEENELASSVVLVPDFGGAIVAKIAPGEF
jgi:hypothetical protein